MQIMTALVAMSAFNIMYYCTQAWLQSMFWICKCCYSQINNIAILLVEGCVEGSMYQDE